MSWRGYHGSFLHELVNVVYIHLQELDDKLSYDLSFMLNDGLICTYEHVWIDYEFLITPYDFN